ncbi:hypothetical protein [Scytonema sp. PRP1]
MVDLCDRALRGSLQEHRETGEKRHRSKGTPFCEITALLVIANVMYMQTL